MTHRLSAWWAARRERSGSPLTLLAAAVLVAVAAVAGWQLGSRTGSPSPASSQRTVALGGVRVAVDGAWRRTAVTRAGVPRVDVSRAAAYEPAPGFAAYAFLLVAPADDPSLVPSALRATSREPLRRPTRTTLDGHPAWRYRAPAVGGRRRMDVTVVPTTVGVVAVACLAHAAVWSFARGCEDGVAHVALPAGARALAPWPAAAVRMRLARVVARLDRRRVRARRELASATRPAAQARWADTLATAYAAAVRALAAVDDGSRAARAVLGPMRAARDGYGDLAAAATSGEAADYAAARAAVARAESSLRHGLDAIARG